MKTEKHEKKQEASKRESKVFTNREDEREIFQNKIRVIKNYKKARTLNAGESKQRETAKVVRSKRSSYKGRRANALALGAEEGRGKLRKAVGSRKQTKIHRYPNGAIHKESYLCIPI